MFELRRCRGAAGDESGEARAEMKFELRRCPPFELSGGLWPSRGEGWVDPELSSGQRPPRGESWVNSAGQARAE